jgi:katanin p60 ATPase-containing subunit A1
MLVLASDSVVTPLMLQALLRRLEKRIMVPLPSAEARAAMFSNLLGGRCTPDVQWQQLAAATDGYSGEDWAVREALLQ